MIVIRTMREIEQMRKACVISANVLKRAGEWISPGMSTWELDRKIHDYIVAAGAVPSFLNYGGFPASACISVNDEVIHGIPDRQHILKDGDIVSVDVGACINGYHGDNAATYACGTITEDAQALLDATKASLFEGIAAAVPGNRVGDIGAAVQGYVEQRGYSVVRQYVGHGVGTKLHEDPNIPNYGTAGRGVRLMPGMTIAIEPMINAGTEKVRVLSNDWTVVTTDGALSAHFENTVAITADGPVILTEPDE